MSGAAHERRETHHANCMNRSLVVDHRKSLVRQHDVEAPEHFAVLRRPASRRAAAAQAEAAAEPEILESGRNRASLRVIPMWWRPPALAAPSISRVSSAGTPAVNAAGERRRFYGAGDAGVRESQDFAMSSARRAWTATSDLHRGPPTSRDVRFNTTSAPARAPRAGRVWVLLHTEKFRTRRQAIAASGISSATASSARQLATDRSVRLVPVVRGAGVDLQRHRQRHRRHRRVLHHPLDDRQRLRRPRPPAPRRSVRRAPAAASAR